MAATTNRKIGGVVSSVGMELPGRMDRDVALNVWNREGKTWRPKGRIVFLYGASLRSESMRSAARAPPYPIRKTKVLRILPTGLSRRAQSVQNGNPHGFLAMSGDPPWVLCDGRRVDPQAEIGRLA